MMEMINKFIPPLAFTQATKRIAFYWAAGGIAHAHQHIDPFRNAESGNLAIYADLINRDGPLVLALSFEEKDLPVVGRQVFYHYFDVTDRYWLKDSHIEFHVQNYVNVPDDESYKTLIGIHVHFDNVELAHIVFKMMQQHPIMDPHFRVNELPDEVRELVYYNLRASMIELPVPKKLGALGQWQGRFAAGTPQSMPYIESIYRNHRLAEWEIRDREMERDRITYIKATTGPIYAGNWDLCGTGWPSMPASPQMEATATIPVPKKRGSIGKSPKTKAASKRINNPHDSGVEMAYLSPPDENSDSSPSASPTGAATKDTREEGVTLDEEGEYAIHNGDKKEFMRTNITR